VLPARALSTPRRHWRNHRRVRRGTSGRSFYNYFRDYDPAIGRYIESDPIGLDGGLNTYAYASQNPIALSDADGRNPAAAGRVGWVLGRVGGVVLDRILIGAVGTSLGGVIYEACHDEDYGFSKPMKVRLPLDVGGEAWGRRHGVGAAEGRRRAHNVKKGDSGRATDKYTVDPATGEVYDPNGDSVGNLNDEPSS
jgi:RHS repeat-associated protein